MDPPGGCVGATVRNARLAAGWSQRELARRAGVHQPQVARLESGEDVQLSLLARVLEPLGFRPGLVDAAAHAGASTAAMPPPPDRVEESVDTWRSEWPDIDPDVFAVMTRLMRAGRYVDADTERGAARHGMNARELIVLGTLRRKGPPYRSTPTGLKQLLWISLPGLKKRLDRLEALGMVSRVPNPDDGRGAMVQLEAAGHAALDDLVHNRHALTFRVLLEMPVERRAQLSVLLRELLARLDEEGAGGEGAALRRPCTGMAFDATQ